MVPEPAAPLPNPTEAFTHVRVIMGMVLGLAVSRLLAGLSRFVQHPRREAVFLPHLVWVAFMLVAIVRFWWFEFYLRHISEWTFTTYAFLFVYTGTYFLASPLLFPDSMEEYRGYRDYFLSRRGWFFGLLVALFLLDIVDTKLKGLDHLQRLGPEYFAHCFALIVLAVAGMLTQISAGQLIIALLSLAVLVTFTARHFLFLY
ncbi:hypothetical protein [Stenotrophomonas pavanii]|uniref:hypothetical protein n=1 Tax=Stenotrophomonas pavanii TaxID=487698 RepID=UPI0039C61E14